MQDSLLVIPSESLVFRLGDNTLSFHSDGTFTSDGFDLDRDMGSLFMILARALRHKSDTVAAPDAPDQLIVPRMLELANRLQDNFPWRTADLDHDTLTDVRELVNWCLYYDVKLRERTVAVLAGEKESRMPHTPDCELLRGGDETRACDCGGPRRP